MILLICKNQENKTRHVEIKVKKLDSHSEKVKLISTKELAGLLNNYRILNDGKYFSENESQNYLIFQPFSNPYSNNFKDVHCFYSKAVLFFRIF